MIQASASFLQRLGDIVITALGVIIPSCTWWVVTELQSLHRATQIASAASFEAARISAAAAKGAAVASATLNQKVDGVAHAMDGINSGLSDTIKVQQQTAAHLEVVTGLKADIAALTKTVKENGGHDGKETQQ